MKEDTVPDPENVWEAIQTVSGETYIYHRGFKEEADVKDVIKVDVSVSGREIVFQYSRFDFNPLKPAPNSPIRINRSIIAFAWFIDPFADIIIKLKGKMQEMDAARIGLIIPGR